MSSGMVWSEDEQDDVIRIEHDQPDDAPRTFTEAAALRLKESIFRDPQHGRYPFNYSDFDAQLLGILVESHLPAGQTLADRFQETLWAEISSRRNGLWKGDFNESPAAYCCLYMSAGDLAEIGQWVLEQYRDRSGPMADWVRRSISDARLSTRKCRFQDMQQHFRYGYQWWVLSGAGNGFTGIGTGGQFLHIFPDQDVVVVQLSSIKHETKRKVCEAMLVHRRIADRLGQ